MSHVIVFGMEISVMGQSTTAWHIETADHWKVATSNEWNHAPSWEFKIFAAKWNKLCGSQPPADWSPRRCFFFCMGQNVHDYGLLSCSTKYTIMFSDTTVLAHGCVWCAGGAMVQKFSTIRLQWYLNGQQLATRINYIVITCYHFMLY